MAFCHMQVVGRLNMTVKCPEGAPALSHALLPAQLSKSPVTDHSAKGLTKANAGFMMSKKPSKANSTQFFWDRKANKNRSRFNLLLLEYGEYLLEDLSAVYFPIPTHDLSTTFEVKDSLKVQGRLKLSTRSLIFEPEEARYPILRFPYKSMPGSLEVFNLKETEKREISVDVSGFFTFVVQNCIEMKENNKVGPYKYVDYAASGGHRSVFALVHADLTQFMVKVEQLRHIFTVSQRQGTGAGNQLLRPFIESAQLWTLQFDTSHLVNFHEKLLFDRPLAAKKIKPLIISPGSLMMTDARVYFQPAQLNNVGDSVLHFDVRSIARVFRRRYLLQQTGLEFILADSSSHLFVLDSESLRDMAYGLLVNLRALSPQAHSGWQPSQAGGKQAGLEALCKRWQRREISNFEYLMQLNSEADRSINDLTQYPVFPHVIADFSSKKLDLESAATFRDLSKPIGALNPERLQYFKQRLHSMPPADPAFGIPPPFLYGTHYSTPGYVLHYLVRVAPEYMLCLQNGKFDAPDRMFHNIEGTWQSCLSNPTDLKELIPEFFTGAGEFLVNFDDLDLGHLHTGERLSDVTLPAWAESPRDFIRKNAKALESEHVSDHLHEWIDLIFGYKQQGQAALEADNLYYYLTYEGAVDLDKVTDSRERDALILQIQEFGQTPKQLFTTPHPCRNSRPSAVAIEAEPVPPKSAQTPSRISTPAQASPPPAVASKPTAATPSAEAPSQPAVAARASRHSGELRAAEAEKKLAELMMGNEEELQRAMQAEQRRLGGAPRGQAGREAGGEEEEEEEDSAGVALIHLDEDFKKEVALELLSSSGASSNDVAQQSLLVVAPPTPLNQTSRTHSSLSQTPRSPHSSPSQGSSAKSVRPVAPREKKPAETLFNTVLSWTFGSPSAAQRQQAATVAAARAASASPTPSLQPPASFAPIEEPAVEPTTVYTPSSSSPLGPGCGSGALQGGNPRKIVMQSSEAFYWHSKAVTGVSAVLYSETAILSAGGGSTSRAGRTAAAIRSGAGPVTEVAHALVASVARDANLKVSRVEQVVTGEFMSEQPRYTGPDSVAAGPKHSLQVTVQQTNVTPRRTNSVSASSLSAVCLLSDKNHVLFSSWDNNLYSYSISHAHVMGKTYAHDDAVTCMSVGKSNKYLATGSLDSSVKLWEIRGPAQVEGGGGLVRADPLAVLSEMEGAVRCVALNDAANLVAAGGEDGTLIVWDLKTRTVLFSSLVVESKKPVHCLAWAAKDPEAGGGECLVCGTDSGRLLCMDPSSQATVSFHLEASGMAAGRPGAQGQGQRGAGGPSVRSLQCCGALVFGGCSDGSIRCWLRLKGSIEEVYRHTGAHTGAVNSISLAGGDDASDDNLAAPFSYSAQRYTKTLVSAGDDCSIKVWRIHCSGDY